MRIGTRVWGAAVAVLAVSIGFFASGTGKADDEKDIRAAILKIADALHKGEFLKAKSQAAALAKKIDDVHDVMDNLGKRKVTADGVVKGGIGVGSPADKIVPDSIELYIIKLGRDAPTQGSLTKEADALERAAYIAAAVAEVALAKPPEKDMGTKTIKLWNTSAAAAREGLLELAKAASSKSPAAVKGAATKVNTQCNNCHSEFKG